MTNEMILVGLSMFLILVIFLLVIVPGLYYSGKIIRIGQKIDRLVELREMTHDSSTSYLKSGDIEAYDTAIKLLQLYQERIDDLEAERFEYIQKSRAQLW